jgi:CheY-like chemotaxis protein
MEDSYPASPSLQHSLVLVIDTSETCRKTAVTLIEAGGRQCVAVSDNLEALAVLVESRPAAICIDRDSGPLDLWQFCQLVRQHPEFRTVLLVAMSSRNTLVEQASAMAAGADTILLKPFATGELESVLGRQQAAA